MGSHSSLYHLHFDASVLPTELDRLMAERYGFTPNDFCGHPPGYRHFEPVFHRVRKFDDVNEFGHVWDEIEPQLRDGGFEGYIEGEFVKTETTLAETPYKEGVPVPFRVVRRRLKGHPDEPFRQAEFHLTLDRDRSDPRLIESLLKAGLYGAYLPKPGYTALVLTMQGYLRDIRPLIGRLKDHLEQVGGVVRGKLKEERAIRWAIFGGADHTTLPEIASQVVYTT